MDVLLAYAAALEGERVATRFPQALQVGVGKAAAAGSVGLALGARRPDVMLLFGVCGAYPLGHVEGEALAVGDLCLVGEDALADEGRSTAAGFTGLDGLGLGRSEPFRADLELTRGAAELLGGVAVIRGATVSTCSGTDASSRALAQRTGARVETMEGAAIALVCERLSVPLVQIRCVSNYTGDSGKWQLDLATKRVQEAVLDLLDRGWP